MSERYDEVEAAIVDLREKYDAMRQTFLSWSQKVEQMMSMFVSDSCDRCGSHAGAKEVTMIGNYYAMLCRKCKNEWTERVFGTEEYEAVRLRSAVINHFESGGGSVEDFTHICAQSETACMQLRALAKQFIAECDAEL